MNPAAAEVCDGVDQDCDGAADEGVPGDGAGCQDPGPPAIPEAIGLLHLTVATGAGESDGTDDAVEFCLAEGYCLRMARPEWDDLERGVIDVTFEESPAVSRADLDRFQVNALEGSDRWVPAGFQVSLDGEVVHCADGLEVMIGDSGEELMSWSDPEGLHLGCETVSPAALTHGPILGAPEADGARIWYRTDATRRALLRVAESAGALADAAPVHYGYPTAERDFTEVVQVFGLRPSTTYAYDLEIEGERFGPWTLRTAPEPGAAGGLRLAFGSCSKLDDQPIFAAIADWVPDAFLFIGDNHYANTDDLSSLRQFYRWAHEREHRAALMTSTPTLAGWDDHDYVGNNTDGTAAGRDVALRAFSEYWANPAYGIDEAAGTFFQTRWGDVALFVVDNRYWRSVEEGSILGSAQEAWLFEALEASDATFKLVASGTQWTSEGSSDSWAAFPDSRQRFLEELADAGIGGVVLLSGDIHRAELRLIEGAAGGYALPELTSSPLARGEASGCKDSEELVACYSGGDAFLGLDFDTDGAEPLLEVGIYDEGGAVIDSWLIRRSELEP